jgi:RNA polymerase sigma-70 factor, ECF subfamily
VEAKLLSEEALLAQARRFDLDGLSLIYDRYSPGLFAYALRLLGDTSQAEECVAETFNRFLQTLKSGGGPERYLQAYLYRMAHNWISDQYRRSPPPPLDLEDRSIGEIPGEAGIEGDCIAREQVRAAMRRLTSEQRQVVMLKYVEGWETDAVAEAMGKPVGAVKALQHRALAALRRLLPSHEFEREGRYEA